jgi:protein involved in polysaccharide export with SLBB domain
MVRAFYFCCILITAIGAPLCAQTVSMQRPDSGNLLRPGDIIRVHAIGDPDVVGEFMIDENGMVTLPKLGARKVTATPPAQLKENLLATYAEFLRYAPEIVFLRRIMVWGAVNHPGLYPVDPTMTLANVLVLAGGASGDGRLNKIKLIRDRQVVSADLGPQTLIADANLRSGDQLYVPQKAWLARNTGIAFGVVSIGLTLFSLLR